MKQIYENVDFILYDETDYGNFTCRIVNPQYKFCIKDKNGTDISKIYFEDKKMMFTKKSNLIKSGIYEKEIFKELFEQVKKHVDKDEFDRWSWFSRLD